MAQDLSLDIAAGPNVAGITLDIAAQGEDLSDAVDLNATNIVPPAIGVTLTVTLNATTQNGNARVILYARWSLDGTAYDDANNQQVVMILEAPTENATYIKSRIIPVQGKSVKFNLKNDNASGGSTLTTGTDIEVFDVHGDQV